MEKKEINLKRNKVEQYRILTQLFKIQNYDKCLNKGVDDALFNMIDLLFIAWEYGFQSRIIEIDSFINPGGLSGLLNSYPAFVRKFENLKMPKEKLEKFAEISMGQFPENLFKKYFSRVALAGKTITEGKIAIFKILWVKDLGKYNELLEVFPNKNTQIVNKLKFIPNFASETDFEKMPIDNYRFEFEETNCKSSISLKKIGYIHNGNVTPAVILVKTKIPKLTKWAMEKIQNYVEKPDQKSIKGIIEKLTKKANDTSTKEISKSFFEAIEVCKYLLQKEDVKMVNFLYSSIILKTINPYLDDL